MASITQTANPAGVSASSNIASYSGVSIGTAASNRIIVVLVATELAASTPSGCTIDYGGGDTAMTAGTGGNLGAVYAKTYRLLVPTGTTATIKVTYSATNPTSVQNHIAVYSVLDANYTSAGGDGSTDMDATDPLTTGAITIATGGVFVAVAAGAADTAAKTWANATEDLDVDAGGFRFTTATRATALTATAVTCTGGTNGEDGALSYLIFADNTSPTVALNTPSDASNTNDTTPTLDFTGTDAESNDIRFNAHVYQPLVTDDFNRADESPIGGNWTNDALGEGADNQLKIVSNQLQAVTAAASCEAYWNANTFSGDLEMYVKVVTKPGNAQRFALTFLQNPGATGAWDGYECNFYDNAGADNIEIRRVDNGTATQLATVDFEMANGDILAFHKSSAGVYTVFQNGLQLATTAADTTYTGSFYAAVTIRDTTGVLDDWGVRQITLNKVSGTDSGFANPDVGGDTDPFTSGDNIQFTVQGGDALTVGQTYYWRVRGIDPSGSNSYGAWSTARSFTIIKTADLTGTVTASVSETDIVTGGKTLIITLTNDTWVTAGATFDAQRQNIINGIDSAQAEGTGWDAVVKATEAVTAVVRTSATVVTVTLSAFATYDITATETITVTIPSTALTGGVAIVATQTFTVSAAGGTSVKDIIGSGFIPFSR